MRARLVQLTRLTVGYSLASFVGPIFTVLLTPLYTRVLRPDDYAILDTVTTLGILMFTLGMLGLNGAASVFFYDHDEAHGQRVVATASTIAVIWSLVIAAVTIAVARPLAAFSLGSEDQALLLYLSAANLPFAVLNTMIQVALRLRMSVKEANTLALGNLALTAALNILFVLILKWGVTGILVANMITTLALTLAGAVMTRHYGWGRPSLALARPLIRAGLPFLPASLSFWALAYIDRLLLPSYAVALHDRGEYAIANKLASMLTIMIVPFQNAWGPLALSMQKAPEAMQTYVKVLTYYAAGALGLALILGLFAREILLIFTTAAYAPAAPFVALLSYVAVANGVNVVVGVGAYITKRTSVLGTTTMLAAAVNLILNVLLIPRYGVWGAVWATALGYASTPIALYILSQRIYPIPFELPKALIALVVQAGLVVLGLWINTGNPWLDTVLKLPIPFLYLFMLIALGVLNRSEVVTLGRMLWRPRRLLAAMVRK